MALTALLRQGAQSLSEGLRGVADDATWRDLLVYRDTSTHAKQRAFIDSDAKRIVIRAGRRGGKTVGIAVKAGKAFEAGRRVLYATPTQEQIDTFWFEVKQIFAEPIARGLLYKNETMHIIELPGTKTRIRAKTAWNADTLRGDYGDLLIFDEWQLMNEDAWGRVGAPMLLDNNGDAVFIYTPPSLHSRSTTKADDPRHAAKLFTAAAKDTTGRWATFHFASHENPHISAEAIEEVAQDMTTSAYKQEILAEDDEDVPGALWKLTHIDALRHLAPLPELQRIVVGIDPMGSKAAANAEAGIVVAALGADGHGYVLEDASLNGTPDEWARAALGAYHRWSADRIIAEKNYGGDMVESTLRTVDKHAAITVVTATRGKAIRAEPVAALYEQGRVHHAGTFRQLEDEMTTWTIDAAWSPNRCFPANTMVTTARGDVPIQDVVSGDLVWTRKGYRRVLISGKTSSCARLLRLTLSCGIIIECTYDHPIYVERRGFIPAWTIQKGEQVAVIASKLSNFKGSSTGDTLRAQTRRRRGTLRRTREVNALTSFRCFTERYGNIIAAVFQKARRFITSTATGITMTSQIFNALPQSAMPNFTRKSTPNNAALTLIEYDRSQRSGIKAKPGDYGTKNMHADRGSGESEMWISPVRSVASKLNPTCAELQMSAFAHVNALVDTTSERSAITKIERALFVAQHFLSRRARNKRLVPVDVVQSSEAGAAPVYDLTIEGEHEFFANGVLVHNCDALVWALTELMLDMPGELDTQPAPQALRDFFGA